MKKIWWCITAAAWAALTVGGMLALSRSDPGVQTPLASISRWPEASPVPRTEGRATLLVGVHPRCPCTKATLTAIHDLVRREPDRLEVVCLATHPLETSAAWLHSSNVDQARGIPGAVMVQDTDGAMATLHGLRTSGQVRLYGVDGEVVFDGGITPGRGMAASGAVVAKLLDPSRRAADRTDAFGCPLVGADGRRP